MTGLYPTRTRLDLLRAVDAQQVVDGDVSGDPDAQGEHWVCPEFEDPVRVTARIAELARAGWVELPDGHAIWRLTDAGRAVLDGAQ